MSEKDREETVRGRRRKFLFCVSSIVLLRGRFVLVPLLDLSESSANPTLLREEMLF